MIRKKFYTPKFRVLNESRELEKSGKMYRN
jgi:hypothetical protein